MGRKAIDYTGYKIGRLTVIEKCSWRIDYLVCNCSCGTKGHLVRKNNLKRTKSCGCLRDEMSSQRITEANKKRDSRKSPK